MNGQNPSKVVHGGTGIRLMRETGAPILDFSASINPYPPQLTPDVTGDLLDRYPDDSYGEVKSVMGRLFGRDADEIAVGNGSIEVIRVLCSSVLSPGQKVMITPPTFGEYEYSARLAGACVGEGPDARIRFLCNPNNPTGHLVDREEILGILDQCEESGCLLAVDEAFIEISDDPSQTTAGFGHPSLFVIRSLTKSFGVPGIRFGYGFGAPDLVERMEARRLPWSVNTVAEQLAMEAFRRYDELALSRERIRQERDRLSAALSSLPLRITPSKANFLLLTLEYDVTPLCRDLLERGILVRDCHSFGLPCSIRVGVRTREQNLLLVEALSACMH